MDDLNSNSNNDDDLSLPKGKKAILLINEATVMKMIQEMTPDDVVCAKETRDLLMDSCVGEKVKKGLTVEFIHLLASESNAVCEKTVKKTINAEHVMEALKNLGFESFLDEVRESYDEHKKEQKDRDTKKSAAVKFGNSGMSQEELLKQQEELFNKARERMMQQQHQ